MTRQYNRMRKGFHVKSRLSLWSQTSTFRPHYHCDKNSYLQILSNSTMFEESLSLSLYLLSLSSVWVHISEPSPTLGSFARCGASFRAFTFVALAGLNTQTLATCYTPWFCSFAVLFVLFSCKSGKQHKTCSSALCTMDDASYFLVIRLGPKTSECDKNVTVVTTVTSCDVTNCATTLHGFNRHASSRREAVSDSRGVPRCT